MAMETSAPEPDANRIEVDNKRLYMKNVWYWSHKNASCLCLGFCLFFWLMDGHAKKNTSIDKLNHWKQSFSYLWRWLLQEIRAELEARGHGNNCLDIQSCKGQVAEMAVSNMAVNLPRVRHSHLVWATCEKNNGMFFSTPTTFLILKRNSDLLFEPRLKQQPDAWLTWMASSATTSARSLLVDMSFVYYLSYLRYHKGSSS